MPSGFFAILDDIGALMDDVAAASKIATRKTAGILGDDLAVNAEKATGFLSSRELPVLWAITKGSLLNKLIIIPIVMLLNVFFPAAIMFILFIGGFYLAYEGMHKIVHYLFHHSDEKVKKVVEQKSEENNTAAEKTKIKSAVTTDFILSVEIVIIALDAVLDKTLPVQVVTVAIVALLATIGVYGIVALIVRMDDAGFKLIKSSDNKGFLSALGNILVKALPVVIKILSVVGTIALLMVSGGLFVHNIDWLHHHFTQIPAILKELLVGVIAGIVAVIIIEGGKKIFMSIKESTSSSHKEA